MPRSVEVGRGSMEAAQWLEGRERVGLEDEDTLGLALTVEDNLELRSIQKLGVKCARVEV